MDLTQVRFGHVLNTQVLKAKFILPFLRFDYFCNSEDINLKHDSLFKADISGVY